MSAKSAAKITKQKSLLESPIPVRRVTLSNGRYYFPTDEYWSKEGEGEVPFVRSVTTINDVFDKGPGFYKWLGNALTYDEAMRYARERAEIGTLVHEVANQMSKDVEIDTSQPWGITDDNDNLKLIEFNDEIIMYLLSFKAFWLDREPVPGALEMMLIDLEKGYGGAIDFYGEVSVNGTRKFGIIDYKTGNERDSDKMQACLYWFLFKKNFPDEPLDFVANVYLKSSWRKLPTYVMKNRTKYCNNRVLKSILFANYVKFFLEDSVSKFGEIPAPRYPKKLPTIINLKEEEDEVHDNETDR